MCGCLQWGCVWVSAVGVCGCLQWVCVWVSAVGVCVGVCSGGVCGCLQWGCVWVSVVWVCGVVHFSFIFGPLRSERCSVCGVV